MWRSPVGATPHGVDAAAHLEAAGEGVLLIDEEDEAHRPVGWLVLEPARHGKQQCHPRAVVVRAWRAGHGVIVGADQDDLLGSRDPFEGRHNIRHHADIHIDLVAVCFDASQHQLA